MLTQVNLAQMGCTKKNNLFWVQIGNAHKIISNHNNYKMYILYHFFL